MDSGLRKFVNVDGEFGRKIMPFSHTAKFTPEAWNYDKMSCADRFAQINHDLTPNERIAVESFVLLCSGGTPDTTSFFEFLHWWALCHYSYAGCIDYLVRYKFHGGQSTFAIRFFREALETGNLKYAFSSPIASVKNSAQGVEVTTKDGSHTYRARRMISAIPLNVLNNVTFDPPLQSGKLTAAKTGHINQCIKVHAEVRDRDLRSWTGITYPHNGLIYALGDGETRHGNTHIVAFGGQHNHFEPDEDIEATKRHLQELVPMDIERIVSNATFPPLTARAWS